MKRRSEIAVELTPLLDVILIMLFMIISRSSNAVKAAEAEAAEREAAYAETAEELNRVYGVAESYETFSKYAKIVSVTVGSGDKRDIHITCGDRVKTVTFGWDNLRYGENSLKAELESIVAEADGEPVFIVFSYESDRIYKNDYDTVSSVMSGIRSRSNNVYLKYYERNGQDGG